VQDVAYGIEMKIPSDLIYLRPVRAFVRELAENMGFGHEKANDMELAVDEIFANAIEHGSAGTGSTIVMQCLPTDDMIEIIVSDTGCGKDTSVEWVSAWVDAVTDKTKSGTERGHGLLLAHSLTDDMSMKPNLTGGVDVHLVMYKEEQQVT
jgi:anti-sigma regulatory factor (Ser/Thr protein kinase)